MELHQEIKTALQTTIVSYRTESGGLLGSAVTHYVVHLSKIYSGEQRYIERRLNEFYSLLEELKLRAYKDLPKHPAKTLMPVRGQEAQDRRKQDLDTFLKDLIQRRDTRNSQEVIEFLELDEFAPEILIQKPVLITKWNCNYELMYDQVQQPQTSQAYQVSLCVFLPKHNLFLLALNSTRHDKKGKKVKLQSYCKL